LQVMYCGMYPENAVHRQRLLPHLVRRHGTRLLW
jgi:hypothetical protein